jgi:RNA polymerase sigma-54 factor
MLQQGTYLHQKTELRPLTTAHLAQTMALLELPIFELAQKIESELSENPALELTDERRCPTCRRALPPSGPCPRCSAPKSLSQDEPIIFISPGEDFRPSRRLAPEDMPEDNYSAAIESLPEYVFRQIATELDPRDHRLAAFLLTNLNEDGLLDISMREIINYLHVPPSNVRAVLALIQRAEPVGVGATSPQEALLVQLDVLAETRPVPPLAAQAINQGMDLLSRHQYAELGRLLDISARQAEAIACFISENLNPYPARSFWGDIRHGYGETPNVFTNPDVVISLLNDSPENPLMVEIISPYSGRLQVNPLFRQHSDKAPADKSEQWKSDLEKADLLVKCLQQRTNTIVRLMRRIVKLQRKFILKGDSHLRPITRAKLAKVLDVHESTISRAVSSKKVQLPNGHIIPLSKFFDRSLSARTALKEIIRHETAPLSDSALAERLAEQGYPVARRTVAKYRAMEGILPSHLRKNPVAVGAA